MRTYLLITSQLHSAPTTSPLEYTEMATCRMFLTMLFIHAVTAMSFDKLPPRSILASQRHGEYRRFISSPPGVCGEQACSFIKEEVKSLSNLKIIRNYVSETVRLLDSLMESMNEELVSVANKLKDTGADSCLDKPSPLDYIVQPGNQENSKFSSEIDENSPNDRENRERSLDLNSATEENDDLFSGIEQHSTDEENEIGSNERWSGSHVTSSSSSDSSSWSQREDRDNFDSREENLDSSSWRGSQSHPTTQSNNWGNNYNNRVNTGSDRDNLIVSREEGSGGNSWGSAQYGQTTQSHKGNHLDYSHQPSGGNSDRDNRGRQLNEGGSYNSGISNWQPINNNANHRGGNCRASSGAFRNQVGIDQWCVDNCSRGFCPATHCICD